MAFPIITYKYNNLEEAAKLAPVVDQKMSALEKYLREGEAVTCEVEFEKVASKNNGQINRLEVNLTVNGALYRVETVESSFLEAIDKVKDELDRELSQTKDKHVTLSRKGGRDAKQQMLKKHQLR